MVHSCPVQACHAKGCGGEEFRQHQPAQANEDVYKRQEVNPMGFTIVVEENGHNPNHSYYDIQ